MAVREQIVKNVGDGAAAATGVFALVADWAPAALTVMAILWFVLRFVNFVRVNALGKSPWHFS